MAYRRPAFGATAGCQLFRPDALFQMLGIALGAVLGAVSKGRRGARH